MQLLYRLSMAALLIAAWTTFAVSQSPGQESDQQPGQADYETFSLGRLLNSLPEVNHQVDFQGEVFPLFKHHCFGCHGAVTQKSRFRIDARSFLFDPHRRGGPLVTAGESIKSPLMKHLLGLPGYEKMPYTKSDKSIPLEAGQIAIIKAWIDQGADWPKGIGADLKSKKHWAYQRYDRPEVPQVADDTWVRNPIDRFILANLEKYDVKPAGRADKRTLIRRLSFDLIGLPPTPEEIETFLKDDSDAAYENLVEWLLASSHFGERWARHWLDVARFAESDGYEKDGNQFSAYHYRDFVIRAFNEDIPYDQFVLWQLAGNEIEPENKLAQAATGFIAVGSYDAFIDSNNAQRDETALYDTWDDMLATTSLAFLGQSVGCARCHEHKYDDISQEEYYQFLKAFKNTKRINWMGEADKKIIEREEADLVGQIRTYLQEVRQDYKDKLLQEVETEQADEKAQAATGEIWAKVLKDEAFFTGDTSGKDSAVHEVSLDLPSQPVELVLEVTGPDAGQGLEAYWVAPQFTTLPGEIADGALGPGHALGLFSGGNWNQLIGHYQGKVADEQGREFPHELTIEFGAAASTRPIDNWGRIRPRRLDNAVAPEGKGNNALMNDLLQSKGGYGRNREKAAVRVKGMPAGSYEVFALMRHFSTPLDERMTWAIGVNIDNLEGRTFTSPGGGSDTEWVEASEAQPGNYARGQVTLSGPEDYIVMMADNLDTDATDIMGFQIARVSPGQNGVGEPLRIQFDAGSSGPRQVDLRSSNRVGVGRNPTVRLGDGEELAFDKIEIPPNEGLPSDSKRRVLRVTGPATYHFKIPDAATQFTTGYYVKEGQGQPVPVTFKIYFEVPIDDVQEQMTDEAKETYTKLREDGNARIAAMRKEFAVFTRVDKGCDAEESPFLKRGDVALKGDPMPLGFLQALDGGAENVSRWWSPAGDGETSYQRRAMGRWLIDWEHGAGPLLARVIVNRLWQHHFGEGLVKTPNNFGTSGDKPLHPELLDWLSRELYEHQWSLKHIHRLMVTSAAYQLGAVYDEVRDERVARITAEHKVREGRPLLLLRRRKPMRLEGEIIRDSILSVSGLLNREMYGPSIFPWIDDEVVKSGISRDKWPLGVEDGPETWRRSIYIFVKRSMLMPMFTAFDTPNGAAAVGRRDTTVVPSQALFFMNNKATLDHAGFFARRLINDIGAGHEERVDRAFLLAYGRAPSADELTTSLRFLGEQTGSYQLKSQKTGPESDDLADPLKNADAEQRALRDFCQVILSSNEFRYVN